MHKLEDIQNSFYQAIFQRDLEKLSFISSSYPAERFNIYRQTIFENMSNALAITFPGIWKLLGKECADNAAYIFCQQQKNLPISGCLDNWGEQFIEFLGQQKELQEFPYLEDYARYEWLKHKAYGAEPAITIKATDLESIPEDIIESIGLSLLPSVFIFSSNFPLADIEKIIEDSTAEAIILNIHKTCAVISRLENKVTTFWLTEDLWLFISYIEQNLNLLQASSKAQESHPDFDLAEAIHFLLQNQLIGRINFAEDKL